MNDKKGATRLINDNTLTSINTRILLIILIDIMYDAKKLLQTQNMLAVSALPRVY